MTIKELALSRNLKRQSEFAKRTGLSTAYVHLLWSGKRLVGRRMAYKLAPLLHVDPALLLGLERPEEAVRRIPLSPHGIDTYDDLNLPLITP